MNLSDRQTAEPVIRRVGAGEAVLAHLRGAIERGDYAVGARLPSEADLGREFDVSRSVVREALRALQALGLTVSRSGKGTFVVASEPSGSLRFGSYSARDLIEVRRHVEVPAAGYAARRHGPGDVDVLTGLLQRMDRETDNRAWVALDSLFHIAVATASGNPVFGKVIEEIRDALARQSGFLNELGGRRKSSDAEHRRIADAIIAGSPEAATRAMTDHLDRVAHTLGELVGEAKVAG
ncbi:FadR/GntR family transcriptional regulator [Amycolatopsis cynarae]|uniref:FadR/GntR family transcriptional regulator n=1 Tax=Amycolatopsis cynarae TaxID=2995223 RepID=A0ABY7AVL6_9PSEU|nr:FadR/GntR family transcriptional regulator [Amycolatopsis sp. HUAS 11-8]WAL63234.1 FadR/GntR family transcriptional regulator [Amycolatopsis sp. HUAS 11-8]